MHTENKQDTRDGKEGSDSSDDSQERALSWLLEMDLSEPEERLFALERSPEVDTRLTEYELEVARRPMIRGSLGADNLETYAHEEIVLSSEDQGGDIYASDPVAPEEEVARESVSSGEFMAVDHSRSFAAGAGGMENAETEGVDILGLAAEDDIGEKYLVVKRVRSSEEGARRGGAAPATGTCSESPGPEADKKPDNSPESINPTAPAMAAQTSQPSLEPSETPALRLVSTDEPVAAAADAASHMALAQVEFDDDLSSEQNLQGAVADPDEAESGVLPAGRGPQDSAVDDTAGQKKYALPTESMEELMAAAARARGMSDAIQTQGEAIPLPEAEDAELLADDALQAQDDALHLAEVDDVELLADDALQAQDYAIPLAEVDEIELFADDALQAQDDAIPLAEAEDADLHADDALQALDDAIPLAEVDDVELLAEDALQAQDDALPVAELDDVELLADDALQAQDDALPVAEVADVELLADDALQAQDYSIPVAEVGDVELVADDSMQAREDATPLAELDNAELFADDALTADLPEQGAAASWQPDDGEIEDIFVDFGESGDAAANAASMLDDAPDVRSEAEQADALEVFAEDMFDDDMNAGLEDMAVSSEAEIDALFDSLAPAASDNDDICGLGVEEFSTAAGHLQLVEEPEEPRIAEPELSAGVGFAVIPAGITFSRASPGGGEIFADFLDAFIEEGSSELEKLEDAVAQWEKDVASEHAYAVVSRVLHTLKGIAKGVGLHFYGTLVHNFETLLSSLPRPQAGAEGDYFRIINAWLDACVRGLDHIQDAREDIANELPQVAGRAQPETQAAAEPETGEATAVPVQAESPLPRDGVDEADARAKQKQLSNKIADEGAKALAAQQSVRITSEKLDHLLNLSNQAQQLSVRTAQSVTRGKRASSEMQGRLASVRAHIAAIADRALRSVAAKGVQPGAPMDALEMDQYTELQEAANILREGVEDLADLVDFATRQNTQVEALLKQQTKVISSIGSSIRGARVVPVSRLLPGLRRLVRTVSVDLNKTVLFKALNELGTLDRDDYARCQTILDHMVRNALDHGIEPAEERIACGKPAEGLVTIDIRKAGADAIITLTDDGRGIDPEKMRELAIRKGLDVDVAALSDAEAARLIFHKGFSTAASISQISGRGVGMDIVLSELQEMGGDIQIDSVPGRGTAFHIRVPSSVTVNGALLVSAGKQSYAIPLGGLIAVEQVPVGEFFAAVQDSTRLSLAGMECEPAYLATLCQSGHSPDAKTWQNNVPVIIAGSAERYMAIAVDDVEEALELVIRSLGTQFSAVPGVAGAATTAAGEAIVALDLNLLVASVGTGDQSSLQLDSGREEGLLVMVVDDSRTQRMVATSQLETLGVETITAENGAVAIDLLNAADHLPDIILMDVEMPVKDGIQALREVRKSVRYGHIPVIMITSRTGLKHRAMAQAAGCNGYMGKPFNFRMLIGQINQLTGQRLQLS